VNRPSPDKRRGACFLSVIPDRVDAPIRPVTQWRPSMVSEGIAICSFGEAAIEGARDSQLKNHGPEKAID
jgi:hypothetical protein